MILSVSRRTDIAHHFAPWFFERVREGFVCVRNPINPGQIRRIELEPAQVEAMVFWTKNPLPMMPGLSQLKEYAYYFQFTLTGYGREIEPGLPDKQAVLIPAFIALAKRIGPERMVWRYDPIFFTQVYTPAYHLRAFEQIARALCGSTDLCVISFLDLYAKNRRKMAELGAYTGGTGQLLPFAGELSQIAAKYGMRIETCAEAIDLSSAGIGHGSCIDPRRIARLTGREWIGEKDSGQREGCGCAKSVDIGAYFTCQSGCVYCYAGGTGTRMANYDVHSPLLCDALSPQEACRIQKPAPDQVRLI